MATIKAIEDRTIHQIQSGQVIVDLCSVVKELVENSLDAGATSIDVRFKNQGLDSIEVQDNGDGITPQNYDTVALKHYTSKLSSYSDLSTLETFGFRGEALSSLCALSKFTVTTCLATDTPKGTKLDFEVSGKVKSTSVVAAQKGTTVSVENLFHNLPVRRRELERNIKREWNRVVGILGQYACIQTNLKMSVTQQAARGKKAMLFSTKGNLSTRENIVNVYGAKTLTALLTLDLKLELEATSGPGQRWSTQEDGGTKEIHVTGHISRPAHGEGRQTPDRQMFFVNGRPCGLPQIAKTFNEVYKQFNNSQSPFIFANIEMDTHFYDVNVSPDKRTILLHDQSRMLDHLKTSLIEVFESQDYTVPISHLPAQKQPNYKQLTITRPPQAVATSKPVSRASTVSTASMDDEEESETPSELASHARRDLEDPDAEVGWETKCSIPSKQRPAAVSIDSSKRDTQTVSLVSKWLRDKAEDRVEQKESNPKPTNHRVDGFSKDKVRLEKMLTNVSKQAEMESEDLIGDPETSSDIPALSPQLPKAVSDFNARLEKLQGQKQAAEDFSGRLRTEDPIEAIISPPRHTIVSVPLGTIQTRPLRSSATTATVTIGGHSITSSIGTTRPKKPRIHSSPETEASKSQLSSFGNRLSQRFAAPGSRDQRGTDEQDADDSESELQSTSAGPKSPPELLSSSLIGNENMETDASKLRSHEAVEDIQMESSERATISNFNTSVSDESSIGPETDGEDGDFVDEEEKKAKEDVKVAEMIKAAEEDAARSSDETAKRAHLLVKGGVRRKDATVHFTRSVITSALKLDLELQTLKEALESFDGNKKSSNLEEDPIDSEGAEAKLSLTIHKSDFAKMKIIGQFNLGFILTSRTSSSSNETPDLKSSADDLFIIDQHASDEKYNFERLQAATIVQSQRLVLPKILDLTAIEEEIVKENLPALESNGFIVTVDESGDYPVGQRCQLISLPLSRETTFALSDLEELIAILSEQSHGSESVPRPSKVRKMFAIRACRSSIMIGKTLTHKQMGKVVTHMGEIDKPWNCPHGRPTMRHLCNLGAWDEVGWREGDNMTGGERVTMEWREYVRSHQSLDTGTG